MPAQTAGSSVTPCLTTVSLYGNRAPSTRVRVGDWLTHLDLVSESFNHAGLENMRPSTAVRHLPDVIAGEVATRRRAHGTRARLILSREASPFSHGAVEERLLRSAEHSVYDFDDALFHDGSGLRRLYGRPAKCRRAVAAADVVIAGNDYLADWASQRARDVRVIPSCVDPTTYQAKDSWTLDETPVIVWLGSPTTEKFVESIAAELRRVHDATGARLRLISGPRAQEAPSLAGFVDRHPWDLATMPQLLADADVAIAPLDDSPFSRGKCAYKLLQYAASGLPIVGSPVGANATALERFSGVPVGAGDSWADAVLSVLREPEAMRQHRGMAGVAAVDRHYSFRAWEDDWRQAVGL